MNKYKWIPHLLAIVFFSTVAVCISSVIFDYSPAKNAVYQVKSTSSSSKNDLTSGYTELVKSSSSSQGSENIAEKINVNEADITELMLLPSIGEVRANAIINLRTELGKFVEIEQLLEVNGIGEKTVETLRDLIVFE